MSESPASLFEHVCSCFLIKQLFIKSVAMLISPCSEIVFLRSWLLHFILPLKKKKSVKLKCRNIWRWNVLYYFTPTSVSLKGRYYSCLSNSLLLWGLKALQSMQGNSYTVHPACKVPQLWKKKKVLALGVRQSWSSHRGMVNILVVKRI